MTDQTNIKPDEFVVLPNSTEEIKMSTTQKLAPIIAPSIGAISSLKTPAPEPVSLPKRKPKSVGYKVLLNGCRIREDLYGSIKAQVISRLTLLSRGLKYSAEELYGIADWRLLSYGECSITGKCISNMVKEGELPLILVKCAHEYPLQYKLK